MNMEIQELEKRERSLLIPAVQCIPGLDEGVGDLRIRDMVYFSDDELSASPYSVSRELGVPLYCKNNSLKYDLGDIERDCILELKEIFHGQVLIDIGSGGNLYGVGVAEMLQAKGYVGIEPYDFYRVRRAAADLDKSIPMALVAEDALTFLKRVPNKSNVSFLLSNMNVSVIPNSFMREEISREIKRALSPYGGVLIYKSDFFIGDPDLNVRYVSRDNFPDVRVGTY